MWSHSKHHPWHCHLSSLSHRWDLPPARYGPECVQCSNAFKVLQNSYEISRVSNPVLQVGKLRFRDYRHVQSHKAGKYSRARMQTPSTLVPESSPLTVMP